MGKKSTVLLTLLLCLAASNVLAKQQIHGKVISSTDNQPLTGVNVIIAGTTTGTATDIEGEFTLSVPETGEYSLIFRYIGFQEKRVTVEVTSDQPSEIAIRLSENTTNLSEVIITGAGGPTERRKIGNSVGSIGQQQLDGAVIQSFSDVLQGRVPGVVGLPSSGTTGQGAAIRIRGSASLSQSNEPIVIIDGVRVDRGGGFGGSVSAVGTSPSRLDDINPESIDRVEILKGAAATTLFGTEASNGVIQIFTKNGQVSAPRFEFKSSLGTVNYPRTIPANTGFATTQAQADTMFVYLGQQVQPYELVSRNYVHDLYETGVNQEYSLSVSGGVPGVTYYVNGRWTGEDGPLGGGNLPFPEGNSALATDELYRRQLSANINIFPNSQLQIRFASAYTGTNFQTFQTGNNINGVISGAFHSKPELVSYTNPSGSSYVSTVQERLQQTVSQDVQHFKNSIGFNYRPLNNLIIDALAGLDYTSQFSESRRPFGWNINNYASTETDGARRTSDRSNINLTLETKATLQHQLNDRLESTLVGGVQLFNQQNLIRSGTGVDFPGPGLNVGGAAAIQSITESYLEETQLGFFIQEQLGYDDYIFVTAGGRFDAHSAFGSNFNGVFYPKISLSVVPTSAAFWNQNELLSSLRFRAAIGQSGLQPGTFDALTTYAAINSATGAGIAPFNLGNPDLRPEVSTEYELGVDVGFFNDRLTFETTYWDRTVRDALIQRAYPSSGGFLRPQLDNIGELRGRGLEVAFDSRVVSASDFSVDVFGSVAYLWEQVTSLGGAAPIKVGGNYQRYRQFVTEGYAPGAHFGSKLLSTQDGFYPFDRRDLLNALGRDASGVAAGTPSERALVLEYLSQLDPNSAKLEVLNNFLLLADENGNGDLYDHYLGKPTPDWTGSFGTTVRYRNFRLNTLFEFSAGNFYVNNLTEAFRHTSAGIGRNTPIAARVNRDYITGGVDVNFIPQNSGEVRLEAAEVWINELLSLDPFAGLNKIQPADFIRWRELSVSYSVPSSVLSKYSVRDLRFTLSGRNLNLWSRYPGVDPEVNAVGRSVEDNVDSNFLLGTDAWNLPLPRRVFFTVTLGV